MAGPLTFGSGQFWAASAVRRSSVRKHIRFVSDSIRDMRLPDKAPRIPLADDNAINRRVAELMLKHAGFTVDIATDGTEAVEAHTSRPYDLILMDSQMPAMDGFEATRCIRQLDQPQPVIIAITANALTGERERCIAQGWTTTCRSHSQPSS
jgi:CheY-like chemotaxis protein